MTRAREIIRRTESPYHKGDAHLAGKRRIKRTVDHCHSVGNNVLEKQRNLLLDAITLAIAHVGSGQMEKALAAMREAAEAVWNVE